ncbi:MAG: transposase [Methylotenera sp.]|nr:transposase [Methylotenera sp.]
MIIPTKISHQKDLRKGRVSQKNQIYHVTFTTINRDKIFTDFEKARTVINILKQSDQLQHTSTLAFVIMPDHIHWLLQLAGSQTLSGVVKMVKSKVTVKLGQPAWQTGYYDHALRKDEAIQNIARYIVANPIRAGLVGKVGDYPHWDAVWVL